MWKLRVANLQHFLANSILKGLFHHSIPTSETYPSHLKHFIACLSKECFIQLNHKALRVSCALFGRPLVLTIITGKKKRSYHLLKITARKSNNLKKEFKNYVFTRLVKLSE